MTKRKHFMCSAALASIVLWGGTAVYGQQRPMDEANPGQTTQGSRSTTATTPDATMGKTADSTFAKKAAAGGMAEVKFGELAQQKASSPAVKQFGQRMVNDHSKANSQLKGVASKDDITLPSGLDANDQATYDKLSKLSGTAFDRAYMKDMVSDHEKDVSDFKREANTGKNSDVKNFASQTLPTLEEHLTLARQTEQQVMAENGATNKNGKAAE
jgi:putative membrane protein